MIFVLVSGSFETMDTPHKADYLGQQIDMPEAIAKSAIADGASLLPKDAFDSLGFNAEELKKYSNARTQQDAPAAFQSKFASAIKAANDYRAQLAAGTSAGTSAATPTKSKFSEVKS